MPISGYFDVKFAESGDLATVPDAAPIDGSVSYESGYGADYSLPNTDPDFKNPERDKMNQIFNDITAAIQQYQQNGTPPFITSAMNGGSPYSYSQYNRVRLAGVDYISLVNSNTTTPPGASWGIVPLAQTNKRTSLTANTTYYVATTGNNTNAGTIGAPWLTLQYAYDYIANNIDCAGYTVTIKVADGTFAPVVCGNPITGSAALQFEGNNTTPANCIINATSGDCIAVQTGVNISVKGFKLTGSGGANGVNSAGYVTFNGNMDFGALTGGGAHNSVTTSGNIVFANNYAITGGAAQHYAGNRQGGITGTGITITLSGTPAFTVFAQAVGLSFVSFNGCTYSGAATGTRYSGSSNAVIDSGSAGATYFPGDVAGSVATGAQYI